MTISESILNQWNNWKHLYLNSPEPEVRQQSLSNLQYLDIQDDGQKNNSIDGSMSIWDIQDPGSSSEKPMQTQGQAPAQDSGENATPDASRQFDTWWNQLPDDVRTRLKDKFAGDDGEFSDGEKAQAVEFMKPHAWTDDVISAGDIDNLRKGLDITEARPGVTKTPETSQLFDTWWSQLPDDVRNKLKEKFAGDDGEFSDEEKGKAVEFMKPHAWTDDVISAGDVDNLRKGLGVPATSDTRRMFDKWWGQLPPDVQHKLKEKFAGSDQTFSEDEMGKAVEYIKSQAGGDDTISVDDIKNLRKNLDLTEPIGGVNDKFKKWMNDLPDDIKNKLKEKFAGPDGVYSDDEKRLVVDFIKTKGKADGDIDWNVQSRLREELGLKQKYDDKKENTKLLNWWLKNLPPDVAAALAGKFAGSDGKWNDAERTSALEYIDSIMGPAGNHNMANLDRLKKDLGAKGLTAAQAEKRWGEWKFYFTDEINQLLNERFGGSDGRINGKEFIQAAEFVASLAGWDSYLTAADLKKLRETLRAG